MTDTLRPPIPPRRPVVSLRATLIIGGATSILVVALVAVALALRVVPFASELARKSSLTTEDFSTRTRVAAELDSAMTDLLEQVRGVRAGTVPHDTLEIRRRRIEAVLRSSATLAPLRRSARMPVEIASEIEQADLAALDLAGALLGAVGWLELGDVINAERMLQTAAALDRPLNLRLNTITRTALVDLTREETALAAEARVSVLVVFGLIALGLILLPLLWMLLSQRLFEPLAKLEEALDRIEQGDLSIELEVKRDDEIGRLQQHFNHTTQMLRAQRAAVQRAAAAAAHEISEAHYRSAFDQASVGLAELSLDGRFWSINRAMTSILGRASEEIVGHNLAEFAIADALGSADAAAAWLTNLLSRGSPLETQWRRGTRAIATVELTGTMLRDADGRERHVLLVMYDVTEQRRLERGLLQTQKLEAIGQLAGGVAHDFNNLLTGIIGYADLLVESEEHPSAIRTDAAAIRSLALRGADLSQSLLALARRAPDRAETFSLNEMIAVTVELMQRTFDRRITVIVKLHARMAAVGDASLMGNALLNLALNSRDAMPDGGTISITLSSASPDAAFRARHGLPLDGSLASIVVSDTGTGMTAAVIERLFEPFFTTKGVGRGTGLGLATAYGTVKAHHGAILVESQIGVGTTFTVYLPAAMSTKATTPVTPLPIRAKANARVLVVDDEPSVRAIATRLLTRLGYTAEEANDGLEAVERFERIGDAIDLVIMDGNMPRLNGVEAARRLLERFPSLPIIYASGHMDPAVMDAVQSTGFRELLPKPYTVESMSRAVTRALNRSS